MISHLIGAIRTGAISLGLGITGCGMGKSGKKIKNLTKSRKQLELELRVIENARKTFKGIQRKIG